MLRIFFSVARISISAALSADPNSVDVYGKIRWKFF